MIRHPIYLVLCLASTVYLALANARGWSLGHTVGAPFRMIGPNRTFNHK
jgi:hypothetical protein